MIKQYSRKGIIVFIFSGSNLFWFYGEKCILFFMAIRNYIYSIYWLIISWQTNSFTIIIHRIWQSKASNEKELNQFYYFIFLTLQGHLDITNHESMQSTWGYQCTRVLSDSFYQCHFYYQIHFNYYRALSFVFSMLPATKSVRFFYYFKGKQRTAFVAGSIHEIKWVVELKDYLMSCTGQNSCIRFYLFLQKSSYFISRLLFAY
jgi:hypothetical protein